MPTKHVIRQGEQLTGICRQKGFAADHVWNAAENAELKRTREKPHVLLPGDEINLPDLEPACATGATGAKHRFKLNAEPLKLNLVLRDASDRPMANKDCVLTIGNEAHQLTTQGDGSLQAEVPPDTVEGSLEIDGNELELKIGYLDPVTEPTGQRARLNNLGYNCGPVDCTCEEPFLSAVEEFQCDNDLQVDGVVGRNTRNKLVEVYGY